MSKSSRQFECRDDLWKRVEALAKRRGISTDDVIQAALVQLFSRKKKAAEAEDEGSESGVKRRPPPARTSAPPPSPARAAPPPAKPGGQRLPPPGGGRPAPRPTPARARPLHLFCEGTWYTIDKDQFVIGRGSKYSDLPIKDANISRRHCAVVRRDGNYYIKDLGSTNGIEYNGERVDDHLIEDGHVYYLCDHELRFTFESPH